MLTEKIKAVAALRVRVAELERAIAADLRGELAQLPAQFGFKDTAAFVVALRRAARGQKGRTLTTNGKMRRRARITDTIRSRVRKLAEEGKTGAEIASRLGISIPSVQNIKKALGLVKKRGR
jgi:DNA-binding NarL/FixJ family response regulator